MDERYRRIIQRLDHYLEYFLESFFIGDHQKTDERWLDGLERRLQNLETEKEKIEEMMKWFEADVANVVVTTSDLMKLNELIKNIRAESKERSEMAAVGDRLIDFIFQHTQEIELAFPEDEEHLSLLRYTKSQIEKDHFKKEFLSYLIAYQLDILTELYAEETDLYTITERHLARLEARYSREDELFVSMLLYYLRMERIETDSLLKRFKKARMKQSS